MFIHFLYHTPHFKQLILNVPAIRSYLGKSVHFTCTIARFKIVTRCKLKSFKNQNYIYSKLRTHGHKVDNHKLQGQAADTVQHWSFCTKRLQPKITSCLFLTTNQQPKEARKILTRHTNLPHFLCIFGLDCKPGQLHMGSRLACQGNGSLLHSSPVFLRVASTHHHLKYAKNVCLFSLARDWSNCVT